MSATTTRHALSGSLRRRRASCAFAALLLALAVTSLSCSSREPRGIRIVLVTLDTLRYDALVGTGGQASKMTSLADWAAESTVFHRFFAATSTTQPSHASMFTGLHPWRHGVTRNGQTLAAKQATIAELLRQAGFTTAAVVASFPVSRAFGFDQGFERFVDELDHGTVQSEWLPAAEAEDQEAPGKAALYTLGEQVTRRAIAALDETQGDRQFFWFHYFDPHDPYGDSRKGKRRSAKYALRVAARGEDPAPALREARRLYDLDVAYLDRWLAVLLDRLDRDATELDTHVILVGDHGESFGEDGSVAHGSRLTPEQIRVPCVIRSSGIEPGARDDPAGSTDVFTTLLALAGLDPIPERGRDLKTADPRARVFGMRRVYGAKQSVRRLDGKRYPLGQPWFYMVMRGGVLVRGNSQTVQLPPGDHNLGSPAAQARIEKLFEVFESELEGSFRQEELDDETLQALQALGYVQ